MKTHIIASNIILLLSLFVLTNCSFGQQDKQTVDNTFADSWEFKGIAVKDSGYTIWGTSPIIGDDGKVHLFVARWPGELKVVPGWRSHSEVAHYVGDKPEGPFKFSDVSLKGTGQETWDKFGAHNPTIQKVGNKYVLLYIGNTNPDRPYFPANQRIGMAISNSLYGPWEKVGDDGLILSTPTNKKYWNYKAFNGVNNPALLQHPNGGYYMYFKSAKGKMRSMGVAVAENITGPYVQLPFSVTANDKMIEDGYAFMYNGKFNLLTTDNSGTIQDGGGILWTSDDGIKFSTYEKGYHRINQYTKVDMAKVAVHYGSKKRKYAKFERPQVLMIDGEPKYLYVASGVNIYGGDCTVSYVLKFKH
ncbi:MAG: glycoside hydrolase family protein [Bacteroidota bacterium]